MAASLMVKQGCLTKSKIYVTYFALNTVTEILFEDNLSYTMFVILYSNLTINWLHFSCDFSLALATLNHIFPGKFRRVPIV